MAEAEEKKVSIDYILKNGYPREKDDRMIFYYELLDCRKDTLDSSYQEYLNKLRLSGVEVPENGFDAFDQHFSFPIFKRYLSMALSNIMALNIPRLDDEMDLATVNFNAYNNICGNENIPHKERLTLDEFTSAVLYSTHKIPVDPQVGVDKSVLQFVMGKTLAKGEVVKNNGKPVKDVDFNLPPVKDLVKQLLTEKIVTESPAKLYFDIVEYEPIKKTFVNLPKYENYYNYCLICGIPVEKRMSINEFETKKDEVIAAKEISEKKNEQFIRKCRKRAKEFTKEIKKERKAIERGRYPKPSPIFAPTAPAPKPAPAPASEAPAQTVNAITPTAQTATQQTPSPAQPVPTEKVKDAKPAPHAATKDKEPDKKDAKADEPEVLKEEPKIKTGEVMKDAQQYKAVETPFELSEVDTLETSKISQVVENLKYDIKSVIDDIKSGINQRKEQKEDEAAVTDAKVDDNTPASKSEPNKSDDGMER